VLTLPFLLSISICLLKMSLPVDETNYDRYAELPHRDINPSAKQTILLIHGATGDGSNWDLVIPHLSNYRLLAPDLPGHGIARAYSFSIPNAAAALRSLILKRAHGGAVYVVGFSLGAHVAMQLVSCYPEITNCVLVSGFQVFPTTSLTPYLPYVIWTEQHLEYAIPRSWIRWAMDGIDIPRPDLSMLTVEYYRQVFSFPDNREKWPNPWSARTLVIAAGKGGLVPSNDRPEDSKKLAAIGRELNSATRAVTHPDMRHPWIFQAPELFAETVRRWFEEGVVPHGFLSL
jgi:pimeloyl-ACP methyl ester carboxylesterase